MISSVIPARLEFSCGHVALVSLPRLKGESPSQRTARIAHEKMEARGRACDFCGPSEQPLLEVRPVQAAVPSGELNGHHIVEQKEPPMHSATPSLTRLGTEETRRTFPPRRRLNDAQEREVARLYAETMMPVPDISKQFSIGESSVYRIAQRRGAGLRGRLAPRASTAAATPPAQPSVAPPVQALAPVVRAKRAPRSPALTAAAVPPPVTQTPPVRKRTPRLARVAGRALQRFEIQFRADTVVQAADVRAALRQVESLGATDVIAIVRL